MDMYRTDHKAKYRTLPISVFDTTADDGNPKYGHWPLHGEDQELRRYFIRHQHETVELLYNMEGILHIELEDQKFRLGAGDFDRQSLYPPCGRFSAVGDAELLPVRAD